MGSPQYIKLNGNLYDPATGKLLRGKQENSLPTKPKVLASAGQKAIDSVLGHGDKTKNPTRKISSIIPNKIRKETKPVKRKTAPNAERPAEHSKTLMRHSVKKPIPMVKSFPNNIAQIKHHAALVEKISNQARDITPRFKDNVLRATQVPKSALVTKFGIDKIQSPVRPKTTADIAPIDVHAKKLEQLADQEKDIKVENDADKYTIVALEKADSFKEIVGKKRPLYIKLAAKLKLQPRTFIISLSAVVVILILGVATYMYYESIAFYLDAKKASISTHLPSYAVPGFSISSIRTNTNGSTTPAITVNYKSNTDSRNYDIVEQSSSWDNQSLLAAVVTPAVGSSYSTQTVDGLTIYGFKTSEVWVNAGVYYLINNNAGLTSDQLLQIVNGA